MGENSTFLKLDLVIIAVTGNDLCKRDGLEGETQPLLREVMGVVDDGTLKASQHVALGIIPCTHYFIFACSKSIGINASLRNLCLREQIQFVNLCEVFFGRFGLFLKDGIHLNERGKTELVRIFEGD